MFQAFKTRAEAVSAEVHRFDSKVSAIEFVQSLFKKEGVTDSPQSYAVWADCPLLKDVDKAELSRINPGLKFEVTRDLAAEARIGISQMDWAVANTGTLAQASHRVDQRLVSTLPFIHVAFVSSSKIVPDLSALLAKLGPRETGYLALITGPSRTADIERVLTIGVHGPEKLIIVFVDELAQ